VGHGRCHPCKPCNGLAFKPIDSCERYEKIEIRAEALGIALKTVTDVVSPREFRDIFIAAEGAMVEAK